MVCVNLLHNTTNIAKTIGFDTARNFSSVYHSMIDKSYDAFVSSEKISRKPSNPILEAVKKAVPIIKEPRVKLAEDLKGMILDTADHSTDVLGKDAVVYPLEKYPNLVLRIDRTVVDELETLPKDMELVPISYEKEIVENNHLGIPLYFATSKNSTIAKKTSISPLEAMAQTNKIMVLKKVDGQHPATECGNKFMSLIGFEDFNNPDPDALNNFSYVFGYVKKNFGIKAAYKCIQMFKNGETYIPPHALAEGSAPFEIVKGKEFYDKYEKFAQSYVKSLKDISEIPQKSYDDAVSVIAKPKSFNMDFQHTNNTFVDLDKQEFNFVDFAYNKKDEKYIYGNPVKEFREVLFGKGFRRISLLKEAVKFLPSLRSPRDFIITPEHIIGVKTYSEAINNKINLSAPQEFRSPSAFA